MSSRLSIVAGLLVGIAVGALVLGGIVAVAPDPVPTPKPTPSRPAVTPTPASARPAASSSTPASPRASGASSASPSTAAAADSAEAAVAAKRRGPAERVAAGRRPRLDRRATTGSAPVSRAQLDHPARQRHALTPPGPDSATSSGRMLPIGERGTAALRPSAQSTGIVGLGTGRRVRTRGAARAAPCCRRLRRHARGGVARPGRRAHRAARPTRSPPARRCRSRPSRTRQRRGPHGQDRGRCSGPGGRRRDRLSRRPWPPARDVPARRPPGEHRHHVRRRPRGLARTGRASGGSRPRPPRQPCLALRRAQGPVRGVPRSPGRRPTGGAASVEAAIEEAERGLPPHDLAHYRGRLVVDLRPRDGGWQTRGDGGSSRGARRPRPSWRSATIRATRTRSPCPKGRADAAGHATAWRSGSPGRGEYPTTFAPPPTSCSIRRSMRPVSSRHSPAPSRRGTPDGSTGVVRRTTPAATAARNAGRP